MANFNTRLRWIVKNAKRTLDPKDDTMLIHSNDLSWLVHHVRIGNKDNLLELNEKLVEENKRLKAKLGVSR